MCVCVRVCVCMCVRSCMYACGHYISQKHHLLWERHGTTKCTAEGPVHSDAAFYGSHTQRSSTSDWYYIRWAQRYTRPLQYTLGNGCWRLHPTPPRTTLVKKGSKKWSFKIAMLRYIQERHVFFANNSKPKTPTDPDLLHYICQKREFRELDESHHGKTLVELPEMHGKRRWQQIYTIFMTNKILGYYQYITVEMGSWG